MWTHGHYDHYSGFGEFYRVQNKVDVYGVQENIEYINRFVYFLKPRYHYVKLYEPFELIGLQFTLFKVNHPPVEVPTGVIIREGDKKSSDYRRYKLRNSRSQPGTSEKSGSSYCRCYSAT
nr:MBL fold metallo-hydrolase [Methanosarcina barkeri]